MSEPRDSAGTDGRSGDTSKSKDHVHHLALLGRDGTEIFTRKHLEGSPVCRRTPWLQAPRPRGVQEPPSRLRHRSQDNPQSSASRTLEIDGDFKNRAEEVLLLFLSTCTTKLESFSCPQMNCFKSKSLAVALNRIGLFSEEFGPCLLPDWDEDSMLHGDVWNISDSEIASTIAQYPRLYEIDLTNCHGSGPHTTDAINCGERLCSFHFSGCRDPTSENLVSILCTARNLHEFMSTKITSGDPNCQLNSQRTAILSAR